VTRSATSVVFGALAVCVIAASIFFRIYQLDHIPGLSGDESALAVVSKALLSGDSTRIRTGTGNLFHPAFHGLVFVVNAIAAPSSFVLRVPSLVFGVLCVLLAYPLLHRLLGRRVALFATLLISTLPLHIAYSRLSQGTALTPLISLLCIYFALRGDWIKTTLVGLLAIWVHPTNIFLAPILIAPFADDFVEWRTARDEGVQSSDVTRVLLAFAAIGVAVASTVVVVSPLATSMTTSLTDGVIARATNPALFGTFVALYGDLLSGTTIYRYFVGNDPSAEIHAAFFWAVFIPVAVLGTYRLWQTGNRKWLFMIAGLLLSLVSFYLVAGPRSISPHYERWAAFLTVPSCVLFAVLLGSLATGARSAAIVQFAVLAISIALLASFHIHYFVGMQSGEGQHRAYRTGNIDPKEQALLYIDEIRNRQQQTLIIAEDWWVYWPMRYLALGYDGYFVAPQNPKDHPWFVTEREVPDFPIPEAERFFVTFAGSPFDQHIRQLEEMDRPIDVYGYSNVPILRIYRDGRDSNK
jgi:hypothetical protein